MATCGLFRKHQREEEQQESLFPHSHGVEAEQTVLLFYVGAFSEQARVPYLQLSGQAMLGLLFSKRFAQCHEDLTVQ